MLALPLLCGMAGFAALLAAEEGHKIELKDVPANALNSLVISAGTADFETIEVEQTTAGDVYEAKWRADGRVHETAVDSDGHLLFLEHTLEKKELPQAVAKTIARLLPKGGEPQFELKLTAAYEAEVEIDGIEYELLISPDGKVLEAESIEEKGQTEND